MADFYSELVRRTAPDQLSLLNLFRPGVGQYLEASQSPSLFNYAPPQLVSGTSLYTPAPDPVEEKKEPEVLTVDTGGAEMAPLGLDPAVLAFLENEAKTPGARDARMSAINNALMTPMAAMGLLGDKATHALSLVIGQIANAMRADKGIQDGRNVPVVDMLPTSYAPGSLAYGVGDGYSVATPQGMAEATAAVQAGIDDGSFSASTGHDPSYGISVI